ncbi:patellin-4-like [Diospyros lotus]|uniref:patellin-4-like n=1 Tax=Diospyros lotus TaxID=55363 RepID=UPI00224EB625|nr:patellin-4-like [Diospyros lotus]
MTVEVKAEETQVAEVVDSEQPHAMEDLKVEESKARAVEKSSSFKEESNFLSDLKEHEKKALNELKSKLEEAIIGDNLFKKEQHQEKEKTVPEETAKEEDNPVKEKDEEEQEKPAQESEEEEAVESVKGLESGEVDKDVSLWGIPLLPSKGSERLDVLLLKFLRARDFKVNDAYQMLEKTLQWRKDFKADSILDEDLGADLAPVGYMSGIDREGHPICYNIFGALGSEELYQKVFGSQEKRELFLRWRFQLMEKGIQKLDFKPGGINSLLQINDLKNAPGPSKKELRAATKQAVGLLQDNYPEFVARNIFINVPFWYYAFNALLSPFITQRTKSKFVVARPGKVTETLLKYIPVEEILIKYGGLKRDNDFEFSLEDGKATELVIKGGSKDTIEIPTAEVGSKFIWDLTVLGWEVTYKEEFVPSDEGSYTIIVQKVKKMNCNEEAVRNSFRNNEPGKIVLTIGNPSSKKKKVFYRYKTQKSVCF